MTRARMKLLIETWRKKAAEHRRMAMIAGNDVQVMKHNAVADAILACADKLDAAWGRIA